MNETKQAKTRKTGTDCPETGAVPRSLRLAREALLDCLSAIGEKRRAPAVPAPTPDPVPAPAKRRALRTAPARKKPASLAKKAPFKLAGRPALTTLLTRQVINVVLHRDRYEPFGINPMAILLHGEPGCGKTYAVDRLVEYLGWPCVRITGAVYSSNAHEDHIREHFEKAFKAKESEGNAVVFMDEMDSFLYNRDEDRGRNPWVVQEANTFLQCLQEAHNKGVLVIGMTNSINSLDPAAIRPERFDLHIEVEMPTRQEVAALLRHKMRKMRKARRLKLDAVLDELAGKSMADAALIVRLIGLHAGERSKLALDQECVDAALKEYRESRNVRNRKNSMGFIK